jgi:hypothetical protein
MLSYSHNNYIFVHLKLQYLKYKSVIKLKLCIKKYLQYPLYNALGL